MRLDNKMLHPNNYSGYSHNTREYDNCCLPTTGSKLGASVMPMPLSSVSPNLILKTGESMDFNLSEADAERFARSIDNEINAYETLDTLSQPARVDALSICEIDTCDDPHNAYVTSFNTQSGDGPLSNLNVGIKDNIAVAGVPMTCGSRVFEGVVPRRNAAVVSRLLDAGACLVGKTNMDELAYGPTSETSAFGVVTNPEDNERVAGGSSSGSAAAVAEGSADIALGSDTGGSIRIPASFCGVVGFKPSWGAVPLDGFVELAYTLDHIGTLATDVETVSLGFDVIGGYDARDPPSALAGNISVGSCASSLIDVPDPTNLSFGVPDELLGTHISDHVRGRFEDTIAILKTAGATVESVQLPTIDKAVFVWNAVTNIEFAAALRRKGLPIGRPGPFDFSRVDATAGRQAGAGVGFGDVVRERALIGAILLNRYNGRHYTRARNICVTLAEEFHDAIEAHDALIAPTMPVVAPKIGTHESHKYDSDDDTSVPLAYNTRPANLAGIPAVTVPDGADGLPVGIQFMAGRYEDSWLLRVARSFELVRDS